MFLCINCKLDLKFCDTHFFSRVSFSVFCPISPVCVLFSPPLELAVLKHVLTPRVKATHVAVDSLKDYLDAVYDVTVAYEGTVDLKGQRKVAPSMTGE